jgi:hypothetical protein
MALSKCLGKFWLGKSWYLSVSGVTLLTFLGTNLRSWRILSTPLAFSFSKKKKTKRLLVWSYGAIQVSRQVLVRKVLGFKCIRCDPPHYLGNEPGLLENSVYPTCIFFM